MPPPQPPRHPSKSKSSTASPSGTPPPPPVPLPRNTATSSSVYSTSVYSTSGNGNLSPLTIGGYGANGSPRSSASPTGSISSASGAGAGGGGHSPSSQKTAKDVFGVVAQEKVCVVRKYGAAADSQIPTILDRVCREAGVEPQYINITQQCASEMLDTVSRKGIPLIFINGDCIGGLTELRQLEKSGFLSESLREHKFDLVVIGGGSGGLAAAKEAARLGKKVACLDFVRPTLMGTSWGLGGTCVNVGCIPKKLFHQAALLGEAVKDARSFGWNVPDTDADTPSFSWERLKNNIQNHIGALNWNYRVQLREKGVTYLNSYGRFTGSHEITATDKKGKEEKITADRFLLATGLRPKYTDAVGSREYCCTSDDLFSLPYNPGKTLCIGASYVALECAGFLSGIGCEAAVMVRSIILRGSDQDMAERIRKHMTERGVRFEKGIPTHFVQINPPTEKEPGLVRVHGLRTDAAGEPTGELYVEEFNSVVIAIGREARTDDLGLRSVLNAQLAKSGKIEGRREQSINVPNLYAVGDVLEGAAELTPLAIQAGRVLMRRLFTGNMELTEYENIPTTVFTPLEYGCCGMAEEAAIAKYGRESIVIYHNAFTPLEFTLPERPDIKHCYLKLICLKEEEERVLGFHILSPNAGEVTQGFAIALKLNAKKADYDRLIGIHPTVAESFTTLTLVKKEGGEEPNSDGC